MVRWGGQALPITYRFRPNGDDPESSIMEIMFLFSKSPDGSHPAPATITMLGVNQKWADAPELGSAAMVADQDTDKPHAHPERRTRPTHEHVQLRR
jgi:hypothetical protein